MVSRIALACTSCEGRREEVCEVCMVAMKKLGAVREGVLRADRITWNGHVRDTVLFSILAEEWPR